MKQAITAANGNAIVAVKNVVAQVFLMMRNTNLLIVLATYSFPFHFYVE